MLGSLLNIFKIPDLRRKIAITIGLVLVYRIGAFVPCPLVNLTLLSRQFSGGAGGLFDMVDMFTGGAFTQMSIFALGIMPYITASIIMQLLQVVWPHLEKLAKEGEAGRKKINQYTRYGTVVLAAFQSMGLSVYLMQSGISLIDNRLFFMMTIVIAMTTGTAFVMWLGEKITEHGIGNGISIIIAVGIMARYSTDIAIGVNDVKMDNTAPVWLLIVPVMYIAVTAAIITMQRASRKIPIQYARRVVGRREMQGGSNFLPLMLNTAGVIPVIFASSILTFPSFIFKFLGSGQGGFAWAMEEMLSPVSIRYNLYTLFSIDMGGIMNILKVGNVYNLLYALLTIFFCYFYTAITFNPVDMADNLKRVGAFIPGRRPGKNTSDYIDYVLTRITIVGSVFLVVVALLPNVLSVSFNLSFAFASMVGGTGLIIVAGVMLDLMNKIESQLVMRHYEGFKYRSRSASSATRGITGSGIAGNRTLGGGRRSGGRR